MKKTRHLLDPQLQGFFDEFPDFQLSDETINVIREQESIAVQLSEYLPPSVSRQVVKIPGFEGSPEVPALLYQPINAGQTKPAFLHMHGGGMVLGAAKGGDLSNINICSELGVAVLSVDYRLAPEHPYPAALHDCYAGLKYLHESGQELGLDRERIAIGGDSAGGGLAASLAIFARDQGEYSICHQHLVYPMLDSNTGKNGLPVDDHLGEYCWTRASNAYGWNAYLGGKHAHEAYVPAAVPQLENLPRAWIGVGDLDLFLPENRAYAQRLSAAKVNAAVDIYPGAPHGFTKVKEAEVTQKFTRDFMTALSAGLGIE